MPSLQLGAHDHHRSKVPYGIQFIRWVTTERTTQVYRTWVLILTFLAYASYQLSRRPISVVKGEFTVHNCTADNLCRGWAPFDSPASGEKLLGALDVAFLSSYAIGMFFSGYLAEHIDLRYFLTFGMMFSGFFSVLFGLGFFYKVHNFEYYFFIQLFAGFFQSTGFPTVVECVGNWIGKRRRGFIMGIWNSHKSIGAILGSNIAGIWASNQWGYSFLVPGCIIGGVAIVVFLFLVVDPIDVDCPSPQRQSKESFPVYATFSTKVDVRNPAHQDGLISNVSSSSVFLSFSSSSSLSSHEEPDAISLWKAILIPGVIEYSFCLFFAKLVSLTFLFWLPFYIENTKIGGEFHDVRLSAELSTFFDVGGMIGGILAGYISDKTGCSGIVVAVMLFCAGPVLFFYRFLSNFNIAANIGLMIIAGILVNGPYSLITTAVSANLGSHPCLKGNTKAMAMVTAIIGGTGSLGATLGPLLTGFIAPKGWNNVFFMLIGADVLAAVLLVRQVWFELSQHCFQSRRKRECLPYLESSKVNSINWKKPSENSKVSDKSTGSEEEPLLYID
ncbi:glucose-6-phosphate exchanger SLC37A2 isoform X1 [Pocillopora verrucosa]|uniref:glucose-6-phosphate exchanger SLC37A2 isoform X1 n=1 Tax=Pocillopora verrucosa TaxID=203993 RepID=UPI0033418942